MAWIVRPEVLERARAAAAADPVSAAVIELRVLYQASFEQMAGLRAGDVGEDAVRFPDAAGARPGALAVRLVPTARRVLAPLAAGRPAGASLLGETAAALRARADELLAFSAAPPGARFAALDACAEQLLHLSENEHGVLSVVRDGVGVWAMSGAVPQGVRLLSGEPPGAVLLWTRLDALVPPEPRLLLLGGGAFVGARWLEERFAPARLDVVEEDPRCLEVARRFFEWEPGAATRVHGGDPLAFVRAAAAERGPEARWDAVVYDLFDARGGRPQFDEPDVCAALAAIAPVVAFNLHVALDAPALAAARAALAAAGLGRHEVVPLRRREDRALVQEVCLVARAGREP